MSIKCSCNSLRTVQRMTLSIPEFKTNSHITKRYQSTKISWSKARPTWSPLPPLVKHQSKAILLKNLIIRLQLKKTLAQATMMKVGLLRAEKLELDKKALAKAILLLFKAKWAIETMKLFDILPSLYFLCYFLLY